LGKNIFFKKKKRRKQATKKAKGKKFRKKKKEKKLHLYKREMLYRVILEVTFVSLKK
jgi:hypothetical protein